MIKFEEHEGKLFKMLDKPVPLKEKDTNVLVQFITHGIIGEYVIEHCLDCNQKNVPIFVDSVDSDGDVTGYIENGNEYICCPFPMFEIIGYPVEEGSAEWALYQMMQGETVTFLSYPNRTLKLVNGYIQDSISDGFWNRKLSNEFLSYASSPGWQIYKEPKPETLFDTWQCPVCGESISAEFEDSGHPRYNEEHLDENLCFAIGDHMKYSHTVEQPKYKVGDWVEHKKSKEQGRITYISSDDYDAIDVKLYDEDELETYTKSDFNADFRKLSSSEVIVKIGCLSGTIGKSCDLDRFLMWHSSPKIDFDYSIIKFSAIDKETRKFVESLLKAQEEE